MIHRYSDAVTPQKNTVDIRTALSSYPTFSLIARIMDRRGVSFDGKKQLNVAIKDNSVIHTVVVYFQIEW